MDTTTAAEPDYSLKDLRINSYGKLPKQSDAIENSIFALMRHAHRLGVRTAKAQSSMTALAAERDALRGLLQEYQWSQGGTCPCCGAWGSGSRQHSPTCYIGIALKEPT